MKMQDNPRNNEQGGAIIWILVMVALLAGLSMVVSRGGRVSGDSLGKEQAQLAATELLTLTSSIRNAVKTLKINGCHETQFSFENSIYINNDGSPAQPASLYTNAPADDRCDLFQTGGAAIRPRVIEQTQIATPHAGTHRTGNLYFSKTAVPGIGSTEPDLIVFVPHITQSVCYALNNQLGAGVPAPRSDYGFVAYDGSFSTPGAFTNTVNGLSAACISDTAADDQDPSYMHFYQVLLAR